MKRGWRRLLLAVLLVVLAATLVLFTVRYVRSSDDTIATVYLDGEALYTFALSEVEEVQFFTVGEPGAQNTIRVSPEGIAVVEADCPDQVCVNQGVHAHGPTPIVCLPHKLSIRFSDSDADAGALDATTG